MYATALRAWYPGLMPRWCVAQVKPKEDLVAVVNLRNQGFETFLPQLREHRGKETKIVSMFPGYLFIAVEMAERNWLRINGTRGVKRLMIATSQMPSLLPRGWVESLQERGGVTDLFIDALNFVKGDIIEFIEGPFKGQSGTCQWTSEKRVGLLLNVLGQDRLVLSEPRVLRVVQKCGMTQLR